MSAARGQRQIATVSCPLCGGRHVLVVDGGREWVGCGAHADATSDKATGGQGVVRVRVWPQDGGGWRYGAVITLAGV